MFRFSRRQIGFVLVVALLLIPAAAVAGHRFADVPNSNIFHNDISWLADKGITKGCNPPANTLFCPKGGVTREQMAAFMHRAEKQLGTRYASAFATDIALTSAANRRLATVYMTAPTSGGAISASATAGISDRGVGALGILWVEINNGGRCSVSNVMTIADGWFTDPTGLVTSETSGSVGTLGAPAGTYRIDLCAWRTGATVDVDVAELAVTWIATGATGGATLSDHAAQSANASNSDLGIEDLMARMIASTSEE
jgi:hypothetical protein